MGLQSDWFYNGLESQPCQPCQHARICNHNASVSCPALHPLKPPKSNALISSKTFVGGSVGAAGMNTTTSINFDAAALQSQDEAEYQKEEQQQQEELRQLLSNALDDITEDGLSVSSNDDDDEDEDDEDGGGEATEHRRQSRKKRSLNGSFEHRHSLLSPHTFPGARTKLPDACNQQHTETMTIPLASNGQMPVDQHCRQQPEVSPQQTPAMYYPQFHYLYSIATDKDSPIMTATSNNYEQQQPTHPMCHQAHQHHFGLMPSSSVAHEVACNNNNNNNAVDANHWLDPHEEIYYRENYGPDPVARQDFYQHHQHHPVVLPHDGTNFAPRHISPHQTNGELHPQSQQHGAPVLENSSVNNKMGFDAVHSRQAAAGQSNGYALLTEAEKPAVSWDQLNGYKVQYRKPPTDGGTNAFQTETGSSKESSPHKQEDFVHIGGSGEQKELVQLQILYKARGRKVDELSQELSNLKKEMDEEVELLQQRVMEVGKERDGTVTSLKMCQDLLQQSKTEVSQLKGQLATSETLAQALTKSKEEVIGKLMSAESAIESLNHQVEELSKSETLERARLQHDSIIEGLQHRYQKEINILNKEIDSLTQNNKSREEEVSMLKRQLNDALKNVENAQINRAETINRLTRTLEESQRQCQHLLQASAQSNSSSQQLTDFQNRLQQAESAKRAAEEKFSDFQQELKSLKYQLSMFDSASKLGVFASKEPDKANSNLENSFQELGIKKKLVFSTPETSLSEDSGNESQIRGLKHELERCLINNREKQALIEELRETVQKLQKEVSDWQLKCSKSEETIEALKVGKNSSFEESLLQKELEATREEVAQCKKDNQNYKERLRLAKEAESQLKACNDDLESKLENIREKCDAEKVSALEQCKKTYETFQDDVKERLLLDLQTQFDEKYALVVSECEKKLSFLKSNLEAALTREDELKEIYVSVCQEKSQLEDQLTQQMTDLQENNANGTTRLSKRDCLEVVSVEVQCRLLDMECNSSAKDVLRSELEQEMKESLLVKIREEIAAETQEKLEAVRQQVTDGCQKEHDDQLENYKKALQEKIEDEVRKEWMVAEKSKQIPVGIQVCLDESEENKSEEYIEKLRSELLAEIDEEKQNEWIQRETEMKKKHLEEMKELEKELQEKSENREVGFGFSISSQIMKERREEERQRIKSGVDAAKIEWQHLHESRLEMEVKRKIAAEKEVWQKDVVAECQREWHGRLQKEKTKWENCAKEQQQKALVAAVETAKNNWAKRQEVHRDEMRKKLEQEKMNLQKEHKEKLQILLNQVQSEYWTSVSSIQKNLVRYLSENSFRMQQLIYLSERNPTTTNLWDRRNFHNASDVNSRQIQNISHRADQLQPQPFVPRPFNSGDGQVLNRIEENSESSYFEISEELR